MGKPDMSGKKRRLFKGLLAGLAACVMVLQDHATAQVKGTPAPTPVKVEEEDCGCESDVLPAVLAVVDGVRITHAEVAESIQENVRELRRGVIDMRNRELHVQVNSRLVEAEAKKRGVTVPQLLEQEVIAKVKAPTEAEVRSYYDQNKARIEGKFEDVSNALLAVLLNQRQKEQATKLVASLRAAAQVRILVQRVAPPRSDADRARVMATVDGRPITSGDIEDALRPLLFKAREQRFALHKSALDVKINNVLLAQEAQKRKITADALLAAEVAAKVRQVTEQDTRAFYEQNKNRLDGEYEQLKDRIMQHVQDQERRKAEEDFAQRLRRAASLQVFLRPPETPVYPIATGDQPSRGGPDAPVTIVEFTDYQCPSCAQTQLILERLAKEYDGQLNIVVRNFPLQQHANAFKAAEAAVAARAQKKYWEYVQILYANQAALDVDRLKGYASQLGLDRKEFDTALDTGKYAAQVQRDLQDGRELGVDSTPTVFVNGRRVAEKTYDSVKAAIDAALKDAATRTASMKAQSLRAGEDRTRQ